MCYSWHEHTPQLQARMPPSVRPSVRVSADDKWRASQSKPICTSIRRGAKWGSTCIFLPAEKPYISAKTLPRGDGIRGRQGGEGGAGPIQLKYLGEKSKCLAKHLLSRRIKVFPAAL